MQVAILDDIHDAWGKTGAVGTMRQLVDLAIFTDTIADWSRLDGFDAVIANRERTRFDRETLAALATVKLIIQTGNHAAHVDFAAARDLGITVAQASGGYSIGAAELAVGLAIATMRRIAELDAAIRSGNWIVPSTPVLHGKSFGVVGLGRVGAHAARIASACGMRVMAWSPRLNAQSARERGAEYLQLDDLLAQSDVLSIHASLNDDSRGLIDARRIALMRPGSYLINTARGPIVDEGALIAALESRHLAGAGLDVFDREPLPPDHPLTRLSNVVLTPHIGWPTDAGYARFADSALQVVEDFVAGRELPAFDH